MTLRPRLRTSLAALVLVALGCQPVDTKPAAKPAPQVEAKTPPAPEAQPVTPPVVAPPVVADAPKVEAPIAGEGPIVTLLEPGAEPREPLRLQLTAGLTQSMVMTMRMGMDIEFGGNKTPHVSSPPMQMTMGMAVKEITADGDIRSDFSLDKIEVLDDKASPPEMVTQLRAMLGTMQKLSGTTTVTTRGLVKAADFTLPPDLNPMLRQTMDGMRQQVHQLSVPLPEPAVGVGAKWTVTQNLEQNNMKLQQVVTWELKERTGTVVKLASTVTQSADPQEMKPPGMPPGAKASLESLNSAGEGTTEIDLTKLAPTKGAMTLGLSLRMTTEANGIKMPMSMSMQLATDIAGL